MKPPVLPVAMESVARRIVFIRGQPVMLDATNMARLRSESVTSNAPGRGGRRHPPYAFTEQGVAMLSTVLATEPEPPTDVTTLATISGYNDCVRFAWDPKKASANLRKHKVSFEEASTAFRDPLSITGNDPDHSIAERRLISFGISSGGRLLVIAHADDGTTVRIISARLATRRERKLYEEG